jgi:hypothetical protein
MIMILENASPLPVKAAGGVRTYAEAAEMILGVKRIGTSGAKLLQMEKVQHQNIKITISMKRGFGFVFYYFSPKCPRKWL